MSRLSRLLTKVLHPMLLLGTGAAWAQATPPPATPQRQTPAQQREQAPEREPRDRGGLPDSVRRVERQTGGEVLRAEPMQRDGREVYRLKVLTADGRVRVVQDDPDRPRDKARPERKSGDSGPKGRKGKQDSSRDSDDETPQ